MATYSHPQPLRRTARHARPAELRAHKNWFWNMLTWIRNLWNWLTASPAWNFIKEEKITVIGVFLITPILAFALGVGYVELQALLGDPLSTSSLLTWENLAHAAMETVQDQLGERPSIEMSMILKDPPPC